MVRGSPPWTAQAASHGHATSWERPAASGTTQGRLRHGCGGPRPLSASTRAHAPAMAQVCLPLVGPRRSEGSDSGFAMAISGFRKEKAEIAELDLGDYMISSEKPQ